MSQEDQQPDASSASEKKPVFDWIAPEGVYEAYANFIHMNWSPYDVRIRFAQIVPDPRVTPDKANWVVNERAAITMAWAEAKFLRDVLDGIVKDYEAKNGELKTPVIPGGL